MKKLVIAIDGPSGAGKGTLARTIAERLGYRHIDTGAMYRAVAWKTAQDGVSLEDDAAVSALAARAAYEQAGEKIIIDGHDVTRAIRTPEVDKLAGAWRGATRARSARSAPARTRRGGACHGSATSAPGVSRRRSSFISMRPRQSGHGDGGRHCPYWRQQPRPS